MIYTVTFNPALDYAVECDGLVLGKTNRSKKEKITAGGKGINVSVVLKNLGLDSVALGFIAGFTGDEIEKMTKLLGVITDFIRVDGVSRINIKLKTGEETEVSCSGPIIPVQAVDQLYEKLAGLTEGDYLVLAGSVPSSMSKNAYAEIMQMLSGKKVNVIVDATGALLKNVLPYKPFLVKPNAQELSEYFGVEIKGKEDALRYAEMLQKEGARNVVVSMGGMGAVMVAESGEKFTLNAPSGEVINTVGSGDSMVAGFIYGCVSGGDYLTAFKTGIASGSASAFSEGLASKSLIDEVLKRVK